MATEIMLDRGGLDGFDWDSQSVGLFAAGGLLGGSAGGAAKRAGVIPGVGTPLKYILSSGLLGTVKAGIYAVPSPDASLGVHFLVLPTDFVITHTTAHGSQPRTDLIIVEMSDVGSASSTSKVRMVTGTAGSGAPEPAMPTSLGNGAAYQLASVLINANATTLTQITDRRVFTVAAGGMVPVANLAAATGLPIGTPYYDLALNQPGVIRAAGATPDQQGSTWTQMEKPATGGFPVNGLNNTGYANLTAAQTTFTVGAGLVLLRAQVDATLVDVGVFRCRFNGMVGSESLAYQNGRQSLEPMALFYFAGGTLSCFLEAAVFTSAGGAHVDCAGVKWLVQAQGGVTA